MNNAATIEKFYSSFNAHDAASMADCYDDNITFQDPAFGVLLGDEAKSMWRMLMKGTDVQVTYSNVVANDHKGSADWVATYTFSKTGRKVVNSVHAEFEFKDGKIIKHSDTFDFWVWSRQALGISGLLLGWTGFLRQKVTEQATRRLKQFMGK